MARDYRTSSGGVPLWGVIEMWLVTDRDRSISIAATREAGLVVSARTKHRTEIEIVQTGEDVSRAAMRAISRASVLEGES